VGKNTLTVNEMSTDAWYAATFSGWVDPLADKSDLNITQINQVQRMLLEAAFSGIGSPYTYNGGEWSDYHWRDAYMEGANDNYSKLLSNANSISESGSTSVKWDAVNLKKFQEGIPNYADVRLSYALAAKNIQYMYDCGGYMGYILWKIGLFKSDADGYADAHPWNARVDMPNYMGGYKNDGSAGTDKDLQNTGGLKYTARRLGYSNTVKLKAGDMLSTGSHIVMFIAYSTDGKGYWICDSKGAGQMVAMRYKDIGGLAAVGEPKVLQSDGTKKVILHRSAAYRLTSITLETGQVITNP
jgi:hypothetical protein